MLFVEYACTGCHRVPGSDLPLIAAGHPGVALGRLSADFQELALAIIDEDHAVRAGLDGEALLNEVLAVRQFTDLAAFPEEFGVVQSRVTPGFEPRQSCHLDPAVSEPHHEFYDEPIESSSTGGTRPDAAFGPGKGE